MGYRVASGPLGGRLALTMAAAEGISCAVNHLSTPAQAAIGLKIPTKMSFD